MSILDDIEEKRRRARGEAPPIPTDIDLEEPAGPEMEALAAESPVSFAGREPHPGRPRSDGSEIARGASAGALGRLIPNRLAESAVMGASTGIRRLSPAPPAATDTLPSIRRALGSVNLSAAAAPDVAPSGGGQYPTATAAAMRVPDPPLGGLADADEPMPAIRPLAPELAPRTPAGAAGEAGDDLPPPPVPTDAQIDKGAALRTAAAAPASGARDWSAARDGARTAARDMSGNGPVERFLQNWGSSMTQGRIRPNFEEANRLDAQALRPIADVRHAEATAKADDLAAIQKRLLTAQADKAARPEAVKPGFSQAEISAQAAATLAKTKAETDAAGVKTAALPLPDALKDGDPNRPMTEFQRRTLALREDQAKKGGGAATPEDDANMVPLANYLRTRGTFPGNLGRDPDGAMHKQILRIANDLQKAEGKPPLNLAAIEADSSAARGSLGSLTKLGGQIESAEGTAKVSGDMVRESSKNVWRTDWPLLNKFVVPVETAFGSGNTTVFANNAHTFAGEYAKIMTGATGGTAASDSARNTAESMLNTAMSDGTVNDVLDNMGREMAGRMAGNESAKATQRAGLATPGGPAVTVTLVDPKTGREYPGIPADKAEWYVKNKGLKQQ